MQDEKQKKAELDSSAFGERLKEARNKKGLTQQELSEMTGISKIMISSYENPNSKNGKNPTLSNVYLLANALDVSIDFLCGNKPKISYADVFKTLVEYDKICEIIVEDVDIIENYSVIPEFVKDLPIETQDELERHDCDVHEYKIPFINFHNSRFDKILEEWKSIKTLYVAGTLSEKIYNLWVQDTLKKCADLTIHVRKHLVSIVEELDDGEDLPF